MEAFLKSLHTPPKALSSQLHSLNYTANLKTTVFLK